MSMAANPVIHVVDDDSAVRDSLSFVLGTADWDVRSYASGADLLAVADSLAPGLIITDVRMPGMTGLELIEALKQRGVRHPIIVLTGHADVAMAVEAMKSGVVDFLEKPFDDGALLAAVERGLELQANLGASPERSEIVERLAQLTARERDVFNAVAAGESNKSAAQLLGISPRTVEIYRANVMEKMQARTLADLVRMSLIASD
ncbi:MAG: response regulator transcription factor [Hyphomonadaceae bacterium]|nr:response regulator transcription factor [Hyphomonadaceae bacterium]